MKAIYFLLPLFMINACKTQTGSVTISKDTTMEQLENKTTDCPEEGTCSTAVHKNKSLLLQTDETGALYPIIKDGANTVVEFTYFREGPAGTADGNYTETIQFEVPSGTENLKKENLSLNDVGLLYGKHCFCRGEAGYYPITEGILLVEKRDGDIVFDLTFKVDGTSQVISHIAETVKL